MSKSWMLVNSQGTTDMVRGDMDILFNDGGVVEVGPPIAVLDQRVRKCAMEQQGSNPFDSNWGSVFRQLLGNKIIDEATYRRLATGARIMLENLIQSQQLTAQRINLDPAEMISLIEYISVLIQDTTLGVRAGIQTQDSNVQDIVMPQVARAV